MMVDKGHAIDGSDRGLSIILGSVNVVQKLKSNCHRFVTRDDLSAIC